MESTSVWVRDFSSESERELKRIFFKKFSFVDTETLSCCLLA